MVNFVTLINTNKALKELVGVFDRNGYIRYVDEAKRGSSEAQRYKKAVYLLMVENKYNFMAENQNNAF